MIILEFIGAIIRFLYKRFFLKKNVVFTDIWKTFDFKNRNAFENDIDNYYTGIGFVIFVIVIIVLFFN
ncbi:hypothetical protein [Aquimarina hainanensis]|uniref:hypothetical protein n=1 Tax=Aquimarina hainanensis TaxID=1578017 RepID=UPI003606C53D